MSGEKKPWESEPDRSDFEESGFKCALRRGPGGHWCGYVGVPEGHPLHSKGYNAPIIDPPKELVERTVDIDRVGAINVLLASAKGVPVEQLCDLVLLVDVHGGLTYADNCAPGDEPNGLWWFGFDCAHAGDFTPEYGRSGTYRDMSYVEAEARNLASQLAAWPTPEKGE